MNTIDISISFSNLLSIISIIVFYSGPLILRQDKGGARADEADGVDKDVVKR